MPELCIIANTVLDWVFNKHGFRLTTWNRPFLTLACKHVHVLKCQSIALPNCLIENRYGPIRVHNMMQGCSKTLACCKRLKDKLTVQAGRSLCLYGDPTYPLRPHLLAHYRIGEVPIFTADMEAFYALMRSVKVARLDFLGLIPPQFEH